MLNINDIKEKLSKTPIPNEIYSIRDNIKEKFKDLEFIEDGHKYYLHKKNGTIKEMNSVSSVCHIFEPFVDWDNILLSKSIKLGITKEELKRTWRENNITSTSNGSLTHLFAEAYMYFFMGEVESMPDVIKKCNMKMVILYHTVINKKPLLNIMKIYSKLMGFIQSCQRPKYI